MTLEIARRALVKLIDTFDNYTFGGEDPITFGDMRLLVGYADEALDALNSIDRPSAVPAPKSHKAGRKG